MMELCVRLCFILLLLDWTHHTETTECRRSIDLVFVIGGSNSLGEDNFNIILKTVYNAVSRLVIGPNDTRVGAVVYGTKVSAYMELQTNFSAFKSGLLMFDYPDDTTGTDFAIKKAVDILTSDQRGAQMMMIIITDGESDNRAKTIQETNAAKAKGIDIWGVGLGQGLNMTELNSLATNGQKQTSQMYEFSSLPLQIEKLTIVSCYKTSK